MKETKTEFRYFTIMEYEKEQEYLSNCLYQFQYRLPRHS